MPGRVEGQALEERRCRFQAEDASIRGEASLTSTGYSDGRASGEGLEKKPELDSRDDESRWRGRNSKRDPVAFGRSSLLSISSLNSRSTVRSV
jgi:hypothetical protein